MGFAKGKRRAKRSRKAPLLFVALASLLLALVGYSTPENSKALLTASSQVASNVYTTGTIGPARSVTFAKSGANAVVSWLAPATGVPVSGYYVEWSNSPSGPWTRVATTGVTTTFTHANAPQGTLYYRVLAYRSNWVPAGAVSGGAVVNPFPAPTNLVSATYNSHPTQVRVTWNPVASSNVTHYYVYRSQCDFWNSGCGNVLRYLVPVTNGNVGQQSHIFTDQVVGRSYWYKVAAGDAAGNAGTPTSDISSANTGSITHTIPTNPSTNGAQSIEVSFVRTNANNKWASEMWSERITHHNQSTADSGLSNYQRRERVPGGAWSAWTNLKSLGPTVPGIRQAWTWWPLGHRMITDMQVQAMTHLDPAKEYQMQGQSCNPAGCSGWVQSAVYTLPHWLAVRQFMSGGVWGRTTAQAGGHSGSFHYRLDRWVDGKGPISPERGADSDFANWPVQVQDSVGDITLDRCPAFNDTCSHTSARSAFVRGTNSSSAIFRSWWGGAQPSNMVGVHSFFFKREGAWVDNRWLISAPGYTNALNPTGPGSFGLKTGTDAGGVKRLYWATGEVATPNAPLKMASDTNWHHYMILITADGWIAVFEDGVLLSNLMFGVGASVNVHPSGNFYLASSPAGGSFGHRGFYDEWMYFRGTPLDADGEAQAATAYTNSISRYLWHLRARQ